MFILWNKTEVFQLSVEDLKRKKLIGVIDYQKFPVTNYMAFKIVKSIVAPDEALVESFKSNLTENGIIEKNRLIEYIKFVNTLNTGSKDYVPFVNLCQSSGSGKSKIAFEIMKELPSAYIVFRNVQDLYSYPCSSALSKLFYNDFFGLNIKDDYSSPENSLTCVKSPEAESSQPSESIVGRYLLLIKALIKDTLDKHMYLMQHNTEPLGRFKEISKEFIDGKFMGTELALVKNNSAALYMDPSDLSLLTEPSTKAKASSQPITVQAVIDACNYHLKTF